MVLHLKQHLQHKDHFDLLFLPFDKVQQDNLHLLNVELLEVIDVIKAVLLPIVESIHDNKEYRLK